MLRIFKFVLLQLLFIVMMIVGCSNSTEPEPVKFFKINIDSVQTPGNIPLGDTLQLRFWGIVGPSGCYSISNFEASQSKSNLELTVWGKYTPANVCAAVIIEMRGTQYSVVPSSKGSFKILVHQPDGSILKDTVIVE